ncbi:MAG: hypothetical protein ACYC6Y_12710 [Thermoguttaceae bacterium]
MRERLPELVMVAMLLVAATGTSAQAGPLDDLFVAEKVEADPNNDYQLSKENGPWLVMACTFSGKDAYEQAHDLALELRREYKVPSYLYSKTFEHAVGENGRGVNRFGEAHSLKYMKGDETTEIAVLAGNFPSLEDLQAQKALERIKNASPECLQLDPNRPTARNLASWRLFFGMAHDAKDKKGPMWKAFLVANPLLPKEYFAPSGLEKFIVDLNQDSAYSLLKCPGKYTVQVAHFTGRVEMDPAKVQAAMESSEFGNKLAEAGEKAEKLTIALREKGFEAYEFHDRYASIVTVGSFESVGSPRPDGKIELDPKLLRIMQVFGAENSGPLPGQPQGVMEPKTLVGIPFDMQPIPVEVPRASISASYAARQ